VSCPATAPGGFINYPASGCKIFSLAPGLTPRGGGRVLNARLIWRVRMAGEPMYYLVETGKSFDQASIDLERAVTRHGFGVLHVHDLATTLRSKGIPFEEQCKIFEVCNPQQAAKVLSTDMRLNMALPCRISVFTHKGKTKIGLIRPVQMLSALSQDAALVRVASEVEEKTIQMVDEAK
jgi:uncharacterized protein (DUF302 family)